MAKTNTEMLKQAEAMGEQAFTAGRNAAPDGAFYSALTDAGVSPEVGSSIPYLKAYNQGWAKAMLAAPVE